MIILYAIISCDRPLFTLYFSVWEILQGIYFPFHSLSLYPFHLSLLSLPHSLYFSFYLSFSLSPSLSLLSIILFGVSNGRFRPCYHIIVCMYCTLVQCTYTCWMSCCYYALVSAKLTTNILYCTVYNVHTPDWSPLIYLPFFKVAYCIRSNIAIAILNFSLLLPL